MNQLSRPSCSFLPASSGVTVPLITLADVTQVSFSRLGVPRVEDLIGGADRRLALIAPGNEFLGERIFHLHRRRGQAEEARQRIGVDRGEVRRRDPGKEFLRRIRVLALRIHTDRDVRMVGNVACVAGILHRRRESAHLELRLGVEA